MGNKVSILLVLIVSGFIPGLGLLLVPERGTANTICAVLYLFAGLVGFCLIFLFGLGIFIWVPAMFVSGTHAILAARSHNARVSAGRAELEGRLSHMEQADTGLGDLTNF